MTTPSAARRPAVFLDRDGTIIEDTGYISKPEDVALRPGAADGIARLNRADVPVIVISNQSGIGRGLYGEADYDRVRARMDDVLRAQGAHVDATYICPHAPRADGSAPCECRKPGTLLYLQASETLGLDPARSWYIGDRWRDVAPAEHLGGRGILVPSPRTPAEELARAREHFDIVPTLAAAVEQILK